MRALFKEPRPRRKGDYYPTPPEAFVALDDSGVLAAWPDHVWEPACGDGRLAEVMGRRFPTVEATDLEDYGYGLDGLDFLTFVRPLAPAIITNPPFSLAQAFIEHSRDLGVEYLALLLKVDFFNAARRFTLFKSYTPEWVCPLTWRLDFTGDGSPPMNCAWFVWSPGGRPHAPYFCPLQKPK